MTKKTMNIVNEKSLKEFTANFKDYAEIKDGCMVVNILADNYEYAISIKEKVSFMLSTVVTTKFLSCKEPSEMFEMCESKHFLEYLKGTEIVFNKEQNILSDDLDKNLELPPFNGDFAFMQSTMLHIIFTLVGYISFKKKS
jgi:hypothetical protein